MQPNPKHTSNNSYSPPSMQHTRTGKRLFSNGSNAQLKQKFILTVFTTLFIVVAALWGQEIVWERLYGDWDDIPDSTSVGVAANGLINIGDTCLIMSASYWQVDLNWDSIRRAWIFKTDMEGNIIWELWIDEEIWRQHKILMRTENGDLLYLTAANIENGRSTRLKLIKISSDGEELWQRTYHYEYSDEPLNAIVTNEGNIMILGERNKSHPVYNRRHHVEFILVLDSDCDSISYHEYWMPADTFHTRTYCFRDIMQLDEDRFLITGTQLEHRNSEIDYLILFEVDALGDSVSFRTYDWNGDYGGFNLAQEEDGDIIVAGHHTRWFGERGYHDVLVAKFNSDLDHIWHRSYGGHYSDSVGDIMVLPDGRIVFTGCFIGDDLSAFGWLQILNRNGEEIGNILNNGIGRGIFSRSTLINGGNEIAIAANTYEESESLLRYLWRVNIRLPDNNVDDQAQKPCAFTVFPAYPNPFNNSTRIKFELSIPTIVTFGMFDINGRLIREFPYKSYTAGQHIFNLDIYDASGIASGQFFISFLTADHKTVIPVTYIK